MAATDDIIGGWIRQAERSGELKQLPGFGKPLTLDDDKHIPAQYRMMYRILKNAGLQPAEVQQINEIADLKAQLAATDDAAARSRIEKSLRENESKLKIALEKFRIRGDSRATR